MSPMDPIDEIEQRLREAGRAPDVSDGLAARILAIPDEAAPAVPVGSVPIRRHLSPARLLAGAAALAACLALVVFSLTREEGTSRRLAFETGKSWQTTGTSKLGNASDGRRRLTLDLERLPRVRSGFYQVWLARSPEDRVAVATIVPDADGHARTTVSVADLGAAYDRVWVTFERADGDPSWSEDWVVKGRFA